MRGIEVREREPVSSANKPLQVRAFPRSCPPSPRPRSALSSSLPMNIPDWSKILRDEYRDNNQYREKREGTGEKEEKRKGEERGEGKENKKL